uniref:Peroxisomal biogenesis factor 6 n=1 Tax=Oryzias latipes TaxID=8090 RepID=A0A3P9HN80_ORYLA
MALEVKLCCLEEFPSHLSPLEALLLPTHLESVFQNATDPPTVLFMAQQPQLRGRTGILLRVHATTEEEVLGCGGASFPAGSGEPVLRLFTSRFFLRHHRLKGTGFIRPMEPVSLDRVVLGARSKLSLRWAGAKQFSAGLSELCQRGEWLLARQGDPLLLPQHPLLGEDPVQVRLMMELLVLDCSPVTQGRITASTALVLTDFWDPVDPLMDPGPCGPLGLCVSDFARYADSLGGGRSLLDSREVLSSGLSDALRALECRLDVRVVDTLRRWWGADVDGCVFLSKHLLLRLGLFNHQWVKLGSPDGEDGGSDACRDRVVSVVVVDLSLCPELQPHGDAAFISATLWFNMTDGEEVPVNGCRLTMKRWSPSPAEPDLRRSDSSCRSASPPIAGELHIQPIVCPSYKNLSCCDELLAEHFSTPRVVSEGDILSVPTENHPDLLENSSEGIHRSPALFFRVQKVKPLLNGGEGGGGGGAYLADRTHTSLFMVCSFSFLQLISTGTTQTRGHAQQHHPASSAAQVDCVTLCADTPAASEAKLTSAFQRAEAQQPCLLLLRNLQLLVRSRGAEEDGRVQAALCQLLDSAPTRVAVVATVSRARDLSGGVMAAFVHRVELESLTEEQRHAMLISLSRHLHLGRDVSLERLSKLTAGFVLGDLNALVVEAGRAACRRLTQSCASRQQEDLCSSGVTVQNQDFTFALDVLQDAQSKSVGAPKIPNVHWEDIGGLQLVKKEILDTVQLPLQHPELLSLGLNRTGVLLYGPPGTGKTLLAKAVATECSLTFLSSSTSRSAAPCVVFFDELDSLAPRRGRSGDSGGVMDRVVSQLLAELDALNSSVGVFVIGATNRPDLLDQSLLRPGRFDKLVYVGINEDRASQLQVLQAILRKFRLDPAVNLQEVVDRCPAKMTGADLYALCSDAMTAAIKRKISLIEAGLDSEESPVLLSPEDFSSALENFKPSVSEQELTRYQNIQKKLTAK